jgi:hypothetical protein
MDDNTAKSTRIDPAFIVKVPNFPEQNSGFCSGHRIQITRSVPDTDDNNLSSQGPHKKSNTDKEKQECVSTPSL